MRVANASKKQGLEKVIHQATGNSYGSDNTRMAGEDETREEERIIKGRAREGEHNTHTHTHTHARTHTHTHTRVYAQTSLFQDAMSYIAFLWQKENHFQVQPFCVGTRCAWVKGHSIANTISGPQPVFPKGLCAPVTKRGSG